MEPEKKSNGALIGLIIVIIILVVGGIYIWQKNKGKIIENPTQNMAATNEDTNSLNSLEQDINNVDPNIGVDTDKLE